MVAVVHQMQLEARLELLQPPVAEGVDGGVAADVDEGAVAVGEVVGPLSFIARAILPLNNAVALTNLTAPLAGVN